MSSYAPIEFWNYPQTEPDKTARFIGWSTVLHILAFAAAAVFSIASQKPPKALPIEIQYAAPIIAAPNAVDSGRAEKQIQTTTSAPKKVASAKKSVALKKAQVAKPTLTTKQKSVVTKSAKRGIPSPKPMKAFLPPSEIETPTLEDVKLSGPESLDVEEFNADSLSEDLEKIDQQTSAQVKSLKSEIAGLDSALDAENAALDELQQQALAEDQRMGQMAAVRRAGDLAALENAIARQKSLAAKAGSGSGGKIRQIADLRQMPGNQRPQYDSSDRLAGRQGQIVVWAYISAAGVPTQFKVVQKTGHRELDEKSLAALRGWRFYPGQEGWVEIPFKWSLKGSTVELPATLRRRL